MLNEVTVCTVSCTTWRSMGLDLLRSKGTLLQDSTQTTSGSQQLNTKQILALILMNYILMTMIEKKNTVKLHEVPNV